MILILDFNLNLGQLNTLLSNNFKEASQVSITNAKKIQDSLIKKFTYFVKYYLKQFNSIDSIFQAIIDKSLEKEFPFPHDFYPLINSILPFPKLFDRITWSTKGECVCFSFITFFYNTKPKFVEFLKMNENDLESVFKLLVRFSSRDVIDYCCQKLNEFHELVKIACEIYPYVPELLSNRILSDQSIFWLLCSNSEILMDVGDEQYSTIMNFFEDHISDICEYLGDSDCLAFDYAWIDYEPEQHYFSAKKVLDVFLKKVIICEERNSILELEEIQSEFEARFDRIIELAEKKRHDEYDYVFGMNPSYDSDDYMDESEDDIEFETEDEMEDEYQEENEDYLEE